MEKKTENIRDKFIESIGNLGESMGLNRTVCQIYALLYFSPEPLSPTEINKHLGISKGNVSINVRKLEEWNAIKKVWKKGYARALYTANENIEEIILDKLKSGIEKRLNYIRPVLDNIKKNDDKNSDSEIQRFIEKGDKIRKLISKIEFFLDNLDTIKSIATK